MLPAKTKAAHTNLIAFGLTRQGFKSMIFHTRVEQANYYNIGNLMLDRSFSHRCGWLYCWPFFPLQF